MKLLWMRPSAARQEACPEQSQRVNWRRECAHSFRARERGKWRCVKVKEEFQTFVSWDEPSCCSAEQLEKTKPPLACLPYVGVFIFQLSEKKSISYMSELFIYYILMQWRIDLYLDLDWYVDKHKLSKNKRTCHAVTTLPSGPVIWQHMTLAGL